jgi:hypothetical protein
MEGWIVRWMVGEVCVFVDCVDWVWREHREVRRRLKRDETTRRSKVVERRRVMEMQHLQRQASSLSDPRVLRLSNLL